MKNIIYNDGVISEYAETIPVFWSQQDSSAVCPVQGFMRYIVNDDYVEMKQIFVREDTRRKGVSSKLFKYFESEVKKLGLKKIVIKAYFGPEQRENPFYKFLLARKYKYLYENTVPQGEVFEWEKTV